MVHSWGVQHRERPGAKRRTDAAFTIVMSVCTAPGVSQSVSEAGSTIARLLAKNCICEVLLFLNLSFVFWAVRGATTLEA